MHANFNLCGILPFGVHTKPGSRFDPLKIPYLDPISELEVNPTSKMIELLGRHGLSCPPPSMHLGLMVKSQ